MLTITGTNLATIKEPKMRAKYGSVKSENVSVFDSDTWTLKSCAWTLQVRPDIDTRECICLFTASHSKKKADFQMMHMLSGL